MRLQVQGTGQSHHVGSWLQSELQQAVLFASENMIRVQEGRKCVDGRYLPYQAAGMIARPGGDGGYVMALLAVSRKKKLGLTPEQCFNAVYKVVARGSDRFCIHTDHHADPDGEAHHGLIGCGHLAKAASKSLAGDYDVEGVDVEKIIEYARNIADISPALEMVNLTGEHKEAGVLVIHSRSFTVSSLNLATGRMYFVYDADRDIEFLKRLTVAMQIPGVTFTDMKRESDLQLAATLRNLAKGLPVYTVAFVGGRPRVQFSHFVA